MDPAGQGAHAGALEAMGEAGRVAPDPAVPGPLHPIPAQRARLLLARGEVTPAARRTKERGLAPDDDPGYPREPEYPVLARVLLAQDDPAQALALTAADKQAAAVDALAKALKLGCPGVMSGCSPTRGRRWPR